MVTLRRGRPRPLRDIPPHADEGSPETPGGQLAVPVSGVRTPRVEAGIDPSSVRVRSGHADPSRPPVRARLTPEVAHKGRDANRLARQNLIPCSPSRLIDDIND